MLDIHATPTVLLYCAGQLVDEFTCDGGTGPRVRNRNGWGRVAEYRLGKGQARRARRGQVGGVKGRRGKGRDR